tara:strand:+ start:362 stop:613 length:252 start_codon:yes stop_codon:yes gene_type:complete
LYQLNKQQGIKKSILIFCFIDMDLDPITKWLVRISSSIIIALGLILVIALPLLAFKAANIISLIQEIIQSDVKDLLTDLVAKI